MAGRYRALGVDDLGEGCGDVVEIIFIGEPDRLARLKRQNAGFKIGIGEGHPESLVRDREETRPRHADRTRRRVAREVPLRRFWSGAHEEDIDDLRGERNAGEDGDGFSLKALGTTAAIEMFVEIENALRHIFGKPHHPGDVGAALAARFDHFLGDRAAVSQDVEDGAEAFGKSSLQSVWLMTKPRTWLRLEPTSLKSRLKRRSSAR